MPKKQTRKKQTRKKQRIAPKRDRCMDKTANGKDCKNYICYASEKYCKIHFLKRLPNRMLDKEDTIRTMASPVTKNVWIGSLASAQHKPFLERYGIRSILNVSGIEPLRHTKRMYGDQGIEYETFTEIDPVTKEEKFMPDSKFDEDFTKADFLRYVTKALRFMKSAPKPILVNCQAGMNRSAAMIAAYLVCIEGKSFERAVTLLENANKPRGIGALRNIQFKNMIKLLAKMCEKTRRRQHPKKVRYSN